ncbi:TIGR03084 family protein [Acidiferrimicrobium sp. IK]|uniref:TIGR03084 family metal-binding protein n=1 Tax=Acidiferrimicrobium sp. IK TaxID=2871700 RepID=UPI0021CB4103|nr:TIGR03084 family metal-binding protein [Acidiferrimicrobium sp. IK]MCU4182846.1 TIGR03084 family protein [Acidiferrimicrobium sp. IK]
MVALPEIAADLAAECAALDERVAGIEPDGWSIPTPAEGWAVRDQISHLAYFDGKAVLALTNPDAFAAHVDADADALSAGAAADTPDVTLGRTVPPAELLADWRAGRIALLDALGGVDPAGRVPWYGPAMSPASFVTARIMETWAHGQDVADALGLAPVVSDRLRHVIFLGWRARPYAFAVRHVEDPGTPVAVEATAPDGSRWVWGERSARERITGPALDLALVFTRRRHPDDTAVVAEGPAATAWLAIAQAFAGGPGPGRPPLGAAR